MGQRPTNGKSNEIPDAMIKPPRQKLALPSFCRHVLLYHKQHVPIPTITNYCQWSCCERTFCPLKLSFAKTIDTFQGQNAGPVDPGKPPNAIQRIICDPGRREFEARKPGITFTMISRATTIGTLCNGKRLDSALYFYDFGFNTTMTPQRITNLRVSPNTNKTYAEIIKRDQWVTYLNSHKTGIRFSEANIKDIFDWAENERVSKSQLQLLIQRSKRQNL